MNDKIPITKARQIADRIRDELVPYAVQIEIAGSIRRGRPFVGDIDLVVIPRDYVALRARVLEKTHAIQDGPKNLLVRLRNGIQLDLFFAHKGTSDLFNPGPSNWGSILLCRTGSKEHNIKLCQAALKLGLHWDTTEGLKRDGKIIASATEEDIFTALGMDYIPPHDRET